jgi:hypothetical protein
MSQPIKIRSWIFTLKDTQEKQFGELIHAFYQCWIIVPPFQRIRHTHILRQTLTIKLEATKS